MHLVMANQGGNSIVLRDYRKGNWTLQETMVLIEAKKMYDERRMKRVGESSEGRGKSAQLRWKWVEDYCWRKGCLRSQNQCNDKWDNLMRDFKKVRDYMRRLVEKGGEEGSSNHEKGGGGGGGGGSYWKIEKNERKERNLPSNMLPQIYEALVGVVERKGVQRVVGGGGGPAGSSDVQPSLPPLLMQNPISAPPIAALPPPPPPPPPAQQLSLPYCQPFPAVG